MAKPIEETWQSVGWRDSFGRGPVVLFPGTEFTNTQAGIVASFLGCDASGDARARLAAQAPAMARLLLGLLNWRPGDPSLSTPDDVRSVLQAAGVL